MMSKRDKLCTFHLGDECSTIDVTLPLRRASLSRSLAVPEHRQSSLVFIVASTQSLVRYCRRISHGKISMTQARSLTRRTQLWNGN